MSAGDSTLSFAELFGSDAAFSEFLQLSYDEFERGKRFFIAAERSNLKIPGKLVRCETTENTVCLAFLRANDFEQP